MIWKNAMKYPVLITGIIMFILFVTNENTKIWWHDVSTRFIPSTCRSLKERLELIKPEHWNQLYCTTTEDLVLRIKFKEAPVDQKHLKALYYRALANELQHFSRVTNPETLEHLRSLKLFLKGKELGILAQTDGQALMRLSQLKDSEEIANHLKLTVKVKEIEK